MYGLAVALLIVGALGVVVLLMRSRPTDTTYQAQLTALAGALNDGIVWIDTDRRATAWNAAARRLLGAELQEGVVIETLPAYARLDARTLGPFGDNATIVLLRERPARPADAVAAPARAARGDAIDHVARGIAHDFNNLLTTIAGRAEMALHHVRAGAPGRSDLEEVRLAATRAAALARRLLDLSREHPLEPRIVSANDVLNGIVPTLRGLAMPALVVVEPALDTGNVNVDPGRLNEVLLVIAEYVIDAVRERRGKITLRTYRSTDAMHASSRGTDASSDFAVIELLAPGFALPVRDAAEASEPFFATTGARGGHALEMASAYAFARESGGTIEMQTSGGSGAIRLILPRVPDDADAPRVGRLLRLDEPRRPTVLVVEDEESVRLFIRIVLEKEGFRVLQAANGVEALRLLDDPSVTVDVLLTDLMMPQMGGRELAERMLSVQPDVRVVFMSGYVADRAALTGVAERNAPLLQKPFSLEEMVRVVRTSIDEPARS